MQKHVFRLSVCHSRRLYQGNPTSINVLFDPCAKHVFAFGLPTVKKLMGHSDIQTTMIHAHLAPDQLAGAVDRLEF